MLKRFVFGVVEALMYGFYVVCQHIPGRDFIAAHLPEWPDAFVPGAFFATPMGVLPSEAADAPVPLPPLNILVLRRRALIAGRVTFVEKRPPNADWNHETFRIDWHGIMNPYSFETGEIEIEGPVGQELPAVGNRVIVSGTFGINLANGWYEIHYCNYWRKM